MFLSEISHLKSVLWGFLCSATHQESCKWVSSSDLQSQGSQFLLSHTLSPYAEESTKLEVTAEATNNNFYFLSENKKFYLRDIGEKQTLAFIFPHITPITAAVVTMSLLFQWSLTVPTSPAVRKWTRNWTWPSTLRPAGPLLTASSAWSTRSNTCSGMMAAYVSDRSHVVCLSWCLLWFLTAGSVRLSETSHSVHSDTEEDQQAEGSLQGLGGGLTLESVDFVDKCNPLKLFEPVTVGFCIFICSPVC